MQASSRFADLSGWIGRGTLGSFGFVLELSSFIGRALRAGLSADELRNRTTRNALVSQLIFSGVDALPVVSLLALVIGVSITAQILALGEALGNEVARLLVSIVGLELGSLLTAFVLIGRSGSAIAVDLGNMKLHREVEALELLGIDLMDFFVAPRLLGMAISQVVLATWFYIVALFGGVLLSGLLFSSHDLAYLRPMAQQFNAAQMALFAAKNFVFGLIIAGTACHRALTIGVSPTEVPQQTQRAIVSGLALVMALDGLFAVIKGAF